MLFVLFDDGCEARRPPLPWIFSRDAVLNVRPKYSAALPGVILVVVFGTDKKLPSSLTLIFENPSPAAAVSVLVCRVEACSRTPPTTDRVVKRERHAHTQRHMTTE